MYTSFYSLVLSKAVTLIHKTIGLKYDISEINIYIYKLLLQLYSSNTRDGAQYNFSNHLKRTP
ncbi:hypothetical protein GCM10008932_18860 [Alkalibacterium iburiense]|uniref:Uncharacterized protein n=1 Tax=Alkalibacterium iburiense TaxID=290589 RepID=A0ABP3HBN5_9LACT